MTASCRPELIEALNSCSDFKLCAGLANACQIDRQHVRAIDNLDVSPTSFWLAFASYVMLTLALLLSSILPEHRRRESRAGVPALPGTAMIGAVSYVAPNRRNAGIRQLDGLLTGGEIRSMLASPHWRGAAQFCCTTIGKLAAFATTMRLTSYAI